MADEEGPHLAKKLKLSEQEEIQTTVSEQEDLEVAMAISASLEVDTLENMTDTLKNNLSELLPPGAGARVLRFDANQDKGKLLAKMIALAQTNMSRDAHVRAHQLIKFLRALANGTPAQPHVPRCSDRRGPLLRVLHMRAGADAEGQR